MASNLLNTFELDIDLKRDNYIDTPVIRQNDDAFFRINIYNDDVPFDITEVVTITLSVIRKDAVTVISRGEQADTNQATFVLPRSSVAIVGEMEAIVQMYDAYNRVSTFSFPIVVEADPSDYVPKDEEKTLIEIILGEGPQAIKDAKEAAKEANEAAEYAWDTMDGVDDLITSTEAVRDSTEEVRVNTEKALQETVAASKYANEQAQRAEEAADAYDESNLVQYRGVYDAATTYEKGNFVSYNGSSFVAKKETTGNVPTVGEYWGVLAQRGIDGEGSVSSVNGIFPDLEGNVTLEIPEPPDVDLSKTVLKEELSADEGADMVGIDDVGDYYGGTTVQAALQEIGYTFNGSRTSLIDSVNKISRM